MAGRKAGAPNISAFIRSQLKANRKARLKDVQAAWKKTGNKGEVSGPLYYQVRRNEGISSGRKLSGRGRPGRPKAPGTNGYLDIEIALDNLVVQADATGNRDLVEAIRTARRIASSKLI